MLYTRRNAAKIALGGLTASRLSGEPNSKFGGVQIGLIVPYSFRGRSVTAQDVLRDTLQLGISGVEMMNQTAENYAGAPSSPSGGQQNSPEQQEARRKAAAELKQWRLSASMDKYKALRKMFEGAGVDIYAFKLGLTEAMSDEEYDYAFNVADALGATHLTMELPSSPAATRRIGEFAAKRKMMVGYHNHLQVNFNSWDTALEQSKYNGINLDIGHYTAATSQSVIPFLQKHYSRIQSLHLKDRNHDRGANQPWGKGQTPIKEVLQLMKKQQWKFPASIELEYPVPEGSGVMEELSKCVAYCKAALA